MIYIKRKSAIQPINGSIVDTTNIENKATNTYSANVIDNLIGTVGGADISTIIDLIYPVGRGFIDFTDTDYSNWLGLTWIRELLGVTPIGYKSGDADFGTIGKTGGEKTHTLTVNEIPSHAHALTRQQWYSSDTVVNSNTGSIFSWKSGTGGTTSAAYQGASSGNGVQNTGGGQAHNNLPPYQVVSYWKRVDPNALISFVITDESTSESKTYQAERGMTWQKWVNSSFNTDDYYIVSGCIVDSKVYPVKLNETDVKPTDTITSTTYTVSNCCFVAGTQVMTTLDGETRSIEEIKSGDSVVSYDIETGKNYLTKVSKVIINKSSIAMALIEFANGSQLEMTDYHPIYTKNGWRSITDSRYEKLMIGDIVKTDNSWTEITNIELYTLDKPITTYTLAVSNFDELNDVDTNDNFYANNIVVHNATSEAC